MFAQEIRLESSVEIVRNFVQPQHALFMGEKVLELYKEDSSKGFGAFDLFSHSYDQQSHIIRGHLNIVGGDDGNSVDGLLRSMWSIPINKHTSLFDELDELDAKIESATGNDASTKMLQIYLPKAKMPKHTDWMPEAESLNLFGTAEIELYWRQSEVPEIIELSPGDLVIFHNKKQRIPHQFTNTSDTNFRLAYTRHN